MQNLIRAVDDIDQILEADKLVPKKQRHTSKRVFERLREEHGFTGGITILKDYIFAARQRQREKFVPLSHPPGHAQADFGEALAVIGGIQRKIHFLVMDLPHSDACFLKAYPAETTEAFCDAHVAAFAFFGGVPMSILYDNTKIAVARILGDGNRKRTRVFSELVSHYLFKDRFGRPGKGNDKGKVEGMVGYTRRNFMVPDIPPNPRPTPPPTGRSGAFRPRSPCIWRGVPAHHPENPLTLALSGASTRARLLFGAMNGRR